MERSDVEKPTSEDGTQLNRNRSFKSKQLVRSQAIRESQSPPRTLSPSPHPDNEINNTANNNVINNVASNNNVLPNNVKSNGTKNVTVKNNVTVKTSSDRTLCDDYSDVCNDVISSGDSKDSGDEHKKQQVEIQITGGSWDEASEQRQRTRRWLGHRHHSDSSRDLLSNNPRVACVCGACANCPHCRGRRRRHVCPIKQDSGIACSEDCPDCVDPEITGGNESLRKTDNVEVEEQYYCRCPERKEKPKNISLSRTDSEEKTEPTGIELVNFLKETLNKNARDRLTLLKIERELRALVSDTGRCIVRFPVMTSYGRMLVHRCAALFQLSHHLDHANKTSVLVSKSGTSGGRMPCTSFKSWCTATFPPSSPQRHTPDGIHAKSILKRDTHSLDEPGNGSLANSRSKSLEQREKDYERMKRRIFSTDNCSQDESQWPWLGAPVKLLTPDTRRNKLLKVQSLESTGPPPNGSGCRGRGAVSKSHSFGGYAGTEPPPHPRLLSRQGDLASSSWRLSPSSSGYKTLSLRSTDSVTPSPTGGASPEPCGVATCGLDSGSAPGPGPGAGPGAGGGGGAVVWCVTDMSAVPPGALLIHPQTGRPLANPDGSVYRFDPANPPMLDPGYPPPDNKMDQNDKKRGKLEKQHSFMDHGECECQPAEETRNKCCCECRRHDACPQDRRNDEQSTPDQKPQKPQSPCKRYETDADKTRPYSPGVKPDQRSYEPTNQKSYPNDVPYYATNERPSFETQANQRPPSYEQTNQRPPSYEQANQRERAGKLTNQESKEMIYNQYGHGVRNDEQVASPPVHPQAQAYPPQEQAGVNMHQTILQAKVTSVPIQDPNMRPMSLTNMVYPTAMPQGYPYMNHCRMDQPLQPVYQQVPQSEEQKQIAQSPHQEPTFRIDPSYPYTAVDYAAQCGACVDPNAMRSFNVSYGQVEIPQAATVLPPAYPVGNMILPQPHIQHYPYQEAVQWQGGGLVPTVVGGGGKLLLPEPYPPLYHNLYTQYSLLYPQVIPQPYPMCQPVYPAAVEKAPSRRNSVGSQRHSAANTPTIDEHHHNNTNNNIEKTLSRRNSNEIAVKIQQIKEQMAMLNTRGRGPNCRREDWRRRAAPGLLGSAPGVIQGSAPAPVAPNHHRPRVHPHMHAEQSLPEPDGAFGSDPVSCAKGVTQGAAPAPGAPNHHRPRVHPHMHAEQSLTETTNDETQLSSAARAIVNSIRNMQAKNSYQDNRRYFNQYRNDYRNRRDREPDQPDRPDRPDREKDERRTRPPQPFQYRQPYLLRQMSPGTWCRRSPGPVHPVLNNPRRQQPDTRNGRR